MVLFWSGIVVFLIGVFVRNFFKIRYYREQRSSGRTEIKAAEIKAKYRPLWFLGIGIQIVGVVISGISLYLS